MTATVSPDNATNKSVTWSSDDEAVAKVGATTGKVTAEGVGEATITVTTANGGKKASYKITVHVPVESITLDKESATLFIGNTLTLTATVTPDTATDKSILCLVKTLWRKRSSEFQKKIVKRRNLGPLDDLENQSCSLTTLTNCLPFIGEHESRQSFFPVSTRWP